MYKWFVFTDEQVALCPKINIWNIWNIWNIQICLEFLLDYK